MRRMHVRAAHGVPKDQDLPSARSSVRRSRGHQRPTNNMPKERNELGRACSLQWEIDGEDNIRSNQVDAVRSRVKK